MTVYIQKTCIILLIIAVPLIDQKVVEMYRSLLFAYEFYFLPKASHFRDPVQADKTANLSRLTLF